MPDSPSRSDGPTAQLIGTTIAGRYRVESLLGSGGMGSVYLVQHAHMRKRYALKILNSQTAQNPEMVARFEREAMAAAHIDHPNVTVAIDFGKAEDGSFFLVLEYLEGQRLRDIMNDGPLGLSRAMHIIRQITGALERSHELGVVHRDLKPENIMLVTRQGDRDFVKVLDFGLAKVALDTLSPGGEQKAQQLTKLGTIFGTPKYMAPEQCISGTIDGRTDLYALGLILYEMVAGVHPVSGKDNFRLVMHQINTPTPPMKTVAPAVSVPASLEAVVMRLTEKEPEKRFASATELLAALNDVAEKEGISPPEPSTRNAAPTGRSGPAVPPASASGQGAAVAPATAPPVASQRPASSGPARPFSERLPTPLKRIPPWLLFGAPIGLSALVLALLLRSGAPPKPEPTAAKIVLKQPTRPTVGRPEEAKKQRELAATRIAQELRAADKCEARRALLPRAARYGDQRTLEQLQLMTQRHNCGPMGIVDCWTCLRQDNALQKSIAMIEARGKSGN